MHIDNDIYIGKKKLFFMFLGIIHKPTVHINCYKKHKNKKS